MMNNVVFFISRSRKRGDRTEISLILSPVSSSLHSINSVAEEATEEAGGKVYIHVRLKKETVSVRIRNVGKEYSLKLIPFSSQIAVYTRVSSSAMCKAVAKKTAWPRRKFEVRKKTRRQTG